MRITQPMSSLSYSIQDFVTEPELRNQRTLAQLKKLFRLKCDILTEEFNYLRKVLRDER